MRRRGFLLTAMDSSTEKEVTEGKSRKRRFGFVARDTMTDARSPVPRITSFRKLPPSSTPTLEIVPGRISAFGVGATATGVLTGAAVKVGAGVIGGVVG